MNAGAAVLEGSDHPSCVVPLSRRRFGELRALRRELAGEPSADRAQRIETRTLALLSGLSLGAAPDGGATSPRRTAAAARQREAVERAKEFLLVHCGERPSLNQVAAIAGYARHHFARIFKQATGLSVHQYLAELRLRHAAVRLEGGAGNLSSLGLALGFSSHSHFTTAFRARFGCAPAAYRFRLGARRHGG